MADSKRRHLRAQVLRKLIALGGRAPEPLTRGALEWLARAARFTRIQTQIESNLELVLGREMDWNARRKLAASVRKHGARQFTEWMRLARGPAGSGKAWLERRVQLDPSLQKLQTLVDAGRGAIIVTAHLGNWELLATALRNRGFEGAVVGLQRSNDPASSIPVDMRAAWDLDSIPQDASPRELLNRLRRGEIVGLLCDLEVRRLDGEFINFFGRPALTMTAPAALARASGLPLLPARCVLPEGAQPNSPYQLSFADPIPPPPKASGRRGTIEVCSQLNDLFEKWIRSAPEQWAWSQPRWRTRPGERVAIPYRGRLAGVPAQRRGEDGARIS